MSPTVQKLGDMHPHKLGPCLCA